MPDQTLRRRSQRRIAAAVIAAVVIGGGFRLILQGFQRQPRVTVSPEEAVSPPASSEGLFEAPMATLSDQLRRAASPDDLLLSTSGEARLAEIAMGRSDPFAPVTQAVAGAQSSASVASVSSNQEMTRDSSASVSSSASAVPVSQTVSLPPVPSVNLAPTPVPLPPIPFASTPVSVAALPDASSSLERAALSPVQAIELSGVVQVGDRVGVIVREAHQQTSRHVFVGDYLAGGQVRLKSIDLSTQEPLIILEYQGEEYPRLVGSGGAIDLS